MILVTFAPPSGTPINGLLLKRESGLCLIAFDQGIDRPLTIGWHRLDGRYRIKLKTDIRWMHPAMRMIEAGDVEGAMTMYRKEEMARKEERLRKEKP